MLACLSSFSAYGFPCLSLQIGLDDVRAAPGTGPGSVEEARQRVAALTASIGGMREHARVALGGDPGAPAGGGFSQPGGAAGGEAKGLSKVSAWLAPSSKVLLRQCGLL